MTIVALPQTGGCLCGAVRYALTGPPLLVYVCHCHDCQTRSGAAFTLNMVIQTADLDVSGPAAKQERTTNGRRIEQGSCARCGISLWASAASAPDFATLIAGTLDDAAWVRPSVQTFVESAIPWAVIPDVRTVAWADFDFRALGREARTTAPVFTRP